MARLPLEGVRVVEMTVIVAGPSSAMFLADLGAEVIRLESTQVFYSNTRGVMPRPPREFVRTMIPQQGGYPDREPGERPWNRTNMFAGFNRNKLSMTADLRRPKGQEIFDRLMRVTDVYVDNNVPETTEKLGITYERLRALKPDIIMVRMPGYGTFGPYHNYRSIAPQFEGAFGHTMLRGYPDMDPSSNTTTCLFGDLVTGGTSAFAMLTALYHKHRTGQGQFIDLASSEANVPVLGQAVMEYTMNGRVPTTLGNRHTSAAPCGNYRCRGEDRWVSITCHDDAEWDGLRRALGNPSWASDPRFADVLSRHRHQDDLDPLIEEWTIQRDHYEVMHLLQREGVPAGPVMDHRDLYNDPHLQERGFFERVHRPEVGTHLYPGMYFKMSGTPLCIRMAAPLLGEHNEYVYKQLLGISDEEYEMLEQEGHIGMDYPADVHAPFQL